MGGGRGVCGMEGRTVSCPQHSKGPRERGVSGRVVPATPVLLCAYSGLETTRTDSGEPARRTGVGEVVTLSLSISVDTQT